MRLKRNQIPGGHKEGRASFPIQSQYKSQKSMPRILPLEKKGEEQREGERATGGKGRRRWAGRGSVLFQALRERGGEGVFMVPRRGPKYP